jgi:ATP-binding cassette subfamily B protein
MDKGRIVETGNHNSLIEQKGTYFNLIKNQLELGN